MFFAIANTILRQIAPGAGPTPPPSFIWNLNTRLWEAETRTWN